MKKILIPLCLMLFGCEESLEKQMTKMLEEQSLEYDSSPSKNYQDTYRNDKVCQDPYGKWHSHMSTCSSCGISYCLEYLPYGNYCSQNCCVARE